MTDSRLVLEAIALRRCLDATYNRTRMKLAPHILYTRHGELFVDAVAVEREGREPGEVKLGTFKLAGLHIAEVVARTFQPLPDFDANDERYRETTPFSVA
ncbi:hypothetical protein [Sphingomonas montanisoli]|uniref:hypothetical protein n=1 Tax=Sphingomonas montanisoli TaxID=2606412 RepID=UPI003CCC7268